MTDRHGTQLLRRDITERGYAVERLEKDISELTTANKELRRKIAELTSANRPLQDKAAQVSRTNEQREQEISKSGNISRRSEQQTADLTAAYEQPQHQVDQRDKASHTERHKSRKAGELDPGEVASLSQVGLKAKSPAQQAKELAEEIVDLNVQMGASGHPDAKQEAILQACDCLDADNVPTAIKALERFIASVAARQGHNEQIAQKEEAEDLMAAAQQIIDQLKAG